MLCYCYILYSENNLNLVSPHTRNTIQKWFIYMVFVSVKWEKTNIKGEIRYACFAVDVSFDSNLMLNIGSNGYTNEIYTFHSIHSFCVHSLSVSRDILYISMCTIYVIYSLQSTVVPFSSIRFEIWIANKSKTT